MREILSGLDLNGPTCAVVGGVVLFVALLYGYTLWQDWSLQRRKADDWYNDDPRTRR